MPYTTVDDNCLTLARIQLKADLKRADEMILAHADIELRFDIRQRRKDD